LPVYSNIANFVTKAKVFPHLFFFNGLDHRVLSFLPSRPIRTPKQSCESATLFPVECFSQETLIIYEMRESYDVIYVMVYYYDKYILEQRHMPPLTTIRDPSIHCGRSQGSMARS